MRQCSANRHHARSGRHADQAGPFYAKPSIGTDPTSKGWEITEQPACRMAGSKMSLDVQAGGSMVGDLKRGGEDPPPLTDGERSPIGMWTATRRRAEHLFIPRQVGWGTVSMGQL